MHTRQSRKLRIVPATAGAGIYGDTNRAATQGVYQTGEV
jgi:hypothetical protein